MFKKIKNNKNERKLIRENYNRKRKKKTNKK